MADQPQLRFGQVDAAELADLVAHEVNNQLNSVVLHLSLLERTLPADARTAVQAELHAIRQTIQRAGGMLHRWQQMSSKPDVFLEKLDLHQLLRELPLPEQLPNSGGQPVSVRFQPVADLPCIRGAREDLRQLVSLLLGSAARASPAKGTVTVRTAQERGQVLLIVEDQGPEVAPNMLERVFEPFAAVRENLHRDSPGELWLSLSKILARRQQGTIAAARGAAGGLEITVRLTPANDK
jgi:two-component system sensor histidine kinase TctE